MLSEMYSPSAGSATSPKPNGHFRGTSISDSKAQSLSPLQSKRSTWNGPGRIHSLASLVDSDNAANRPHSPPTPSVASFGSEPQDRDREFGEDAFGTAALGITSTRRRTMAKTRRELMTPDRRPISPLAKSSASAHFPASPGYSRSPLTGPPSPTRRGHRTFNSGSISTRSSPNRRSRALSCSTLRSILDRALLSRRYVASHLLALRFEEDAEDNAYWEDAISVMALLADALRDAASTLTDALDEYQTSKLADQVPTPPPQNSKFPVRSRSPSPILDEDNEGEELERKSPLEPIRGFFNITTPSPSTSTSLHLPLRRLPSAELSSFAPMPTDLAQFAAHMDNMSHAIERAQNELRSCLVALQTPPLTPDLRAADAISAEGGATAEKNSLNGEKATALAQTVMDSYAQLRKELGGGIEGM